MVMVRLDIEGSTVIKICFDQALTILTSSHHELRIETDSSIEVSKNGLVSFDPENSGLVADKLLQLLSAEILDAQATDSGWLRLLFEGDVSLVTGPHGDYEAWEIVGAGGKRVVCMPGGELAIWQGDSP
jgi:hypothetical protein